MPQPETLHCIMPGLYHCCFEAIEAHACGSGEKAIGFRGCLGFRAKGLGSGGLSNKNGKEMETAILFGV